MRRAITCCLLIATVLAFSLAEAASALTKGVSREVQCGSEEVAARVAVRSIELTPAEGASVDPGVSAAFSAEGIDGVAPTFEIASSVALVATPDIDRGAGSPSGTDVYSFTSMKAAATPRTIYWSASFTLTLDGCEGPSTFTTPVRTLNVVAPPPLPAPAPEPQPSSPRSAGPSCVVPRLTGRTLSAARRALRRAHCALGTVAKPSGHRGRLLVARQSIRPGRQAPAGTKVSLGLARASVSAPRPTTASHELQTTR